jgi:hypothetical protein
LKTLSWSRNFGINDQNKNVMAKAFKPTNQQQVTEHLRKLDPQLRDVVETIRKIILETDTEIDERIKWNNLSFYYTGEMKPFDPKEYKSDIAVFNLHKNRIMLVFPTGSNVNDTSGLLEGDYKDGRRIANFTDMKDVESKKTALQHVIQEWIRLIEK